MTSSTDARARTLGFRTLVVLGGAALAVTALALPSRADTTPAAGFVSMQTRLLDTRTAPSVTGPVHGLVPVDVSDLTPSGSTVELTITSVDATGTGNIVAYPDGSSLPKTADLYYVPGRNQSSTFVVPVPTDGVIDVYVAGASTQIVVDEQGYFDSSALGGVAPTRLADTRTANTLFAKVGPQSAGTTAVSLGSAYDNKTVALGLTALPVSMAGGTISAYTAGSTVPATTLLSYNGGIAASDLVVVTASSTGVVDLVLNGASTNLLVDLEATAPTGSTLETTGVRIADSRVTNDGLPRGPFVGAATVTVKTGDAPSGTTGVIVAITSTGQLGNGIITAYPAGTGTPGVSELQFTKGSNITQTVIVAVKAGTAGTTFTLRVSNGASQVVVDTEGYVGAVND